LWNHYNDLVYFHNFFAGNIDIVDWIIISIMAFEFRLREDMPRGFLTNPTYPELPAIVKHLRPSDGERFDSANDFEQAVLQNYSESLAAVPVGPDPHLREGLMLEGLPERLAERLGFNGYWIYTKSTSPTEICVFGYLAKLEE